MIILDTNVLSEPLRPRPSQRVVDWLDAQAPEALFLTTISLAELFAGIETLPAGRRRAALKEALSTQIRGLFGERILAFDVLAAEAFAQVNASAVKQGNRIPFADAAIASIAKAHGFVVATRNLRDFKGTGVAVLDPWA